MKAEHRHELKTNDLALWISNLPTWGKENLRTIIYVAVVVVLVLASAIYYRYQKTVVSSREEGNLTMLLSQLPQQEGYIAQKQMKGEDNAFQLFQFTDSLDSIAKSASNNNVAALALIKEAEVIRTELQYRFGVVSPQDIATQTGKAKDLYNKALDKLKQNPNPTLEGIAKIGLGLCDEEQGNADAARKQYQEVAAGAAYAGTVAQAAAKNRLVAMDSFTEKVVLKPMPKSKIQMQPPVVAEPNLPGIN
jgi:Tfp pilus assembly protein PilE